MPASKYSPKSKSSATPATPKKSTSPKASSAMKAKTPAAPAAAKKSKSSGAASALDPVALEVVARLNVTREQRLAVGEVMKQSRKNMADLRRGKNRDEYIDDFEAEEVRRSERALEVLTGEQRTGWSELVGKPIDVASLRKRTNPIRHPMRLPLRQRTRR